MRPSAPRLLFPVALILLLGSCARPGPPLPPSLELPRPVTDLRAVRKGSSVYLRWTVPTQTTDGQSARGLGMTRICRSPGAEMKECGTPVAGVPAPEPAKPSKKAESATGPTRTEGSYADTLPPGMQGQTGADVAVYAVEVSNGDGRNAGLSNKVAVPLAATLPAPAGFAAEASSDGIVLSWVPGAPPELSGQKYVWRIYRAQEGSRSGVIAGEVSFDSTQFVDHGFEWQKTYSYRITGVTLIPQAGKPELQVEGDDSTPIQVFANDIFPPAVPSGLQAVFSGAGQQPFIDLIWAPDTESDLAGYNVYRHEEGGATAKLNSEVAKSPSFRDSSVQSGRKYYYSVSAVDVRGNESGRSEEASEPVP